MKVLIIATLLSTIEVNKIYTVFDDLENDERYIIDSNNVKVLFDGMIFKYTVVDLLEIIRQSF